MDVFVTLRRAVAGVCRQLGRVIGLLVAVLLLFFLILESAGARELPPFGALAPMCVMSLGLIVAFRWPLAGALVALAGYVGVGPRLWPSPLLLVPVAAVLDALGWLLGRDLPPAPDAPWRRRVVWGMWALVVLFFVVVGLALSYRPRPLGPAQLAQAGLEGTWHGNGHIAEVWVGPRRRIPVTLVIRADGTADATIGEAHLAGARVLSGRGALGRALNLTTDYALSGTLSGPIVPEWGLSCGACSIGFNVRDGRIHGGMGSTCTEGARKPAAVNLGFRLERTP